MQLLSEMKQLSQIGYGFMAAKALFAALDLELFSHLASQPRTTDELQRSTRASPNALHTLLRACTSLGLVGLEGERYVNSPAASQYLAKNSARYVGDYFRYQIDRQIYPWIEQLNDALHGKPTTTLYARMASLDEAELFSNAQHVGSLGPAHLLAQRIDASAWRHLLDVAGGSGAFSIALCKRAPALRATILDFESVTPVARRYVQQAGMGDRISTLEGEATAIDWPDGVDAVLMSYLLSAMPAESFGLLFDKAYRCLRPGGTLLVHDFMLDESRHGPTNAALWFLVNAVGGPGHISFSAGDLATLLRDSRFDVKTSEELLPGITGLLIATRPA